MRALLDKVFDRGAPREAEKQRQLLGVMFRWAVNQDILEHNPMAGIASYGTSPRRDRVLSASEIKFVWQWLQSAKLPVDYAGSA